MNRPGDFPFLSSRSCGCPLSTKVMPFLLRQVFWLPDHPTCRAFPSGLSTRQWHTCGFRPRLQRRDHPRFTRGSLFSSIWAPEHRLSIYSIISAKSTGNSRLLRAHAKITSHFDISSSSHFWQILKTNNLEIVHYYSAFCSLKFTKPNLNLCAKNVKLFLREP